MVQIWDFGGGELSHQSHVKTFQLAGLLLATEPQERVKAREPAPISKWTLMSWWGIELKKNENAADKYSLALAYFGIEQQGHCKSRI